MEREQEQSLQLTAEQKVECTVDSVGTSDPQIGRTALFMLQQYLHPKSKPAQEAATTRTPTLRPPKGYDDGAIMVAPDHATDRAKIAGFDQVANSHTRVAAAPSHVRLPKSLVSELDGMWAESQATHREQGGNLVRTYGGNYELNRTHDPSDDGNTYNPDTSNVGWLDRHAAIVHTHPLGPSEPDHVSFSNVDLEDLVDEDQPLNILRSGRQTYMVARTKEFDALIDKNNDPQQLFELKRAMRDVYDGAYQAEKRAGGSHPTAVEKGVIAVCRTFHLIYYWGQGQDLHRIR